MKNNIKLSLSNHWLNWKKVISFFTLIAASLSVQAASSVSIENGHVRETIPGTKVSSAYMDITNKGDKAIKLVKVTGAVSERIEIHEHAHVDGMMKMQQVKSLSLAAGETVKLQPGGYHIMIFDLKQALKSGDKASFTFYFSDDSKHEVELPIESIVRKKKQAKHHHHH